MTITERELSRKLGYYHGLPDELVFRLLQALALDSDFHEYLAEHPWQCLIGPCGSSILVWSHLSGEGEALVVQRVLDWDSELGVIHTHAAGIFIDAIKGALGRGGLSSPDVKGPAGTPAGPPQNLAGVENLTTQWARFKVRLWPVTPAGTGRPLTKG